MAESLDILVFSPHPDDAEIGCGGSLLLATDKGQQVVIADLSEGEQSTRGTRERRAREKATAADLLGLSDRLSVGLPDTEIGSDPANRQPLIQIIRETRPRIVLAPYWNDRHPDHAAAGTLVQHACFYAGVGKLGSGHPYRPERLFYYMLHNPFEPSLVVDISPVWSRKLAVLAAYESQLMSHKEKSETSGPDEGDRETAISRPDFMRAYEARAIWLGAMIGSAYGEAFFTSGPVPLSKLPGLDSPAPISDELPPYNVYL